LEKWCLSPFVLSLSKHERFTSFRYAQERLQQTQGEQNLHTLVQNDYNQTTMTTQKPRIAVLALGGTIAMVKGKTAVRPGLSAENLIAAVPDLAELADLRAETISKLGSFDLTVDSLLEVATRIQELANRGEADGVVITQGTDTIEETAFLLDVVLNVSIPVVVIGAMRNPLMTAPDGPGNLLAAVRTVTDKHVRERARELGVLVVMLDSIHTARHVAKADASRIDAFASPATGPAGVLIEDRVRLHMFPDRHWHQHLAELFSGTRLADVRSNPKNVGFVTIGLDESGGLLKALSESKDLLGYDGLILAAMGGGHVPGKLADHVSALASRIPVVIAPRAGSGILLKKTYEMIGAELDLAKRGTINAGSLPPLKARVLLTLLLQAQATPEQIAGAFAAFG